MNLNELTLVQARKGLDAKEFTALDLTKACLKRISERNGEINAFITVCEESALKEAQRADELISSGKAQALTGIPFSVKDAICTKGVRSTGAGKILDNYIPPFDATVIKKIREQGGVLIGKTNCDAFGHGASNENSMYGAVKNPHDLSKVAGGSSGGSAAAVADQMCIFSIAEDTGGSIRQPASFCGVVGLRPSYGRNSRYGIMPMASSLDTVGPITKTVEDMAIVMEAIAGVDQLDATTVQDVVPKYSKLLNTDIAQLKIGIPKEYFEVEGIDEEVRKMVEQKIDSLKKLGCSVEPVSLPHTKYAISTYYVIVPSEDSSNLARLEGIRYGVRAQANTLFDTYADARAGGFPEEVKRRILIGTSR
jgi:aspartyl-tRNA(Asn)/glutamyl-tRNA(Gln) amidotransferase subunit A